MKPFTNLLSRLVYRNNLIVHCICNDGTDFEVICFTQHMNVFSIRERGDGEEEIKRVGINMFERIIDTHQGVFDVTYENM